MEETQQQTPLQTQNVGFPGAQTMTPVNNNEPRKNWKWLIVLILFLVVIAAVTFFVFKSSRTATSIEESPTPDTASLTNLATPETTATPVASPSTDRSTVKIQVLNGTGVAGEAGILASALKELGYTSVTTGNASDQNNTDTLVTFSSSLDEAVVAEITNKLKDMYTNVTTNTGSTGDNDIQVTTGLRKGQTTSASSTPEPTATPAQ